MIFIISPLVQSSDCRQLVYYANVSLHLESMARVVVRVWKCETTSVSHDKKPQAFSLCFFILLGQKLEAGKALEQGLTVISTYPHFAY